MTSPDMTRRQIYSIWNGIQRRCRSDGDRSKKWPTYQGVSCAFRDHHEFSEWAKQAKGFGELDSRGRVFHLDKDIISPGSRIYSPETCAFVPARINTLMNSCGYSRGNWPNGVHYSDRDKCFYSKIRIDSKRVHLGCYDSPTDAHKAWQEAKHAEIISVLSSYIEHAGCDDRVADSLRFRIESMAIDIEEGIETI